MSRRSGETRSGFHTVPTIKSSTTADESAFLRQFAAQIGVALREREDDKGQSQNSITVQQSVHDLYRALVFDEPLLDYHLLANLPVVASALARQLLDSKSDYALSNRLVNGIVYFCQKQQVVRQEEQSATTTTTTTQSPTALAMAKLAFACLIQVPLQCCTAADNITELQAYLGSYQGTPIETPITEEPKQRRSGEEDHDARIDNLIAASSQAPQASSSSSSSSSSIDNVKETSSCSDEQPQQSQLEDQEVWAAESDPSDYDFTEGLLGEQSGTMETFRQQQHEFTFRSTNEEEDDDDDTDWLDPKVLSRPPPQFTLLQAHNAMQSLLQLATYTLLQPIFFQSEIDKASIQRTLTQLILTLLQPTHTNNNNNDNDNNDNAINFQSLSDSAILAPVWIWRDAASYHWKKNDATNKNSKASRCCRHNSQWASSYLQLLQTLLAVDQAHLQDLQQRQENWTNTDTTTASATRNVCVASIVGLSALSAWCGMLDNNNNSEVLEITIETLMDSMNDLAHILERCTQEERMAGSVVFFLESLSGIYYDRFDRQNTVIAARNNVAQAILNSGFLRQVLSLVIVNTDHKTAQAPSLYHPIYHALWGLCIAYPKIVGKYVFRYPGTNDLVRRFSITTSGNTTTKTNEARDCVQCILWNVFGWMQCQESAGAGRLVLKQPGGSAAATSPPLTQDECQEVCAKGWSRLCQMVTSILQDPTMSDEIGEQTALEWNRLLSFARMLSIATTMNTLLDTSCLDRITVSLANRSKEDLVTNKLVSKPKIDDLDSKELKLHNEETHKPSKRQHVVSQIRKVLKEYNLHFQETLAMGSSKTD